MAFPHLRRWPHAIRRLAACSLLTAIMAATVGGAVVGPAYAATDAPPVCPVPSKPGDWNWAEAANVTAPVALVVDLERQLLFAHAEAVPVAVSTISSGRKGYATPTGVYAVLQKRAEHYSNLYDNAPMPFMLRLTWSGVALHAGRLPGYPASHGCVRLPAGFASKLFNRVRIGTPVVILDSAPVVLNTNSPFFLNPPTQEELDAETARLGPDIAHDWRPKRAVRGQLSLVLSLADRMLVVMRHGLEIGRARVSVTGEMTGQQIFQMTQTAQDAAPVWKPLSLPVLEETLTDMPITALEPPLSAAPPGERHFAISPHFRQLLAPIMAPGSILTVIEGPLSR